MQHQATLRRIGLGITALCATLAITVSVADAFTGPGSAGGVGSGAIASDAASNVTIGNNETLNSTKLAVYASSTSATHYGLQVLQPGGAHILYVRNDGAVSIPGSLTVGIFTGVSTASNISAGAFGPNTGGGNYSFPANVSIGTASPTARLTIESAGGGNSGILVRSTTATLYSSLDFVTTAGGLGFQTGLYGPSHATHPNKGFFYQNAANPIGFFTSGTERLLITGAGNVGIGTAGVYKLDVAGDVNLTGALRIAGAPGTSGFVLRSNGTSAPSWVATSTLGISGGSSTTTAPNVGAGAFGANVGGGAYSFPANLTVTGLMGVGVAPTYKLDVLGDINLTGALRVAGAAGTAGYVLQSNGASAPAWVATSTLGIDGGGASTIAAPNVSSGAFGANTGGGNYNFPANVSAAGLVGIGLTPTTDKLEVLTTGTSRARIRIMSGTGIAGTELYTNGYSWYLDNRGNSEAPANRYAIYNNAGTEMFTILPSGNIGIGGNNPGYKLDVAGDINLTGALRAAGSAGTAGYVLQSNGASAPAWVATSTLGISGGASTMAAPNISAGAFGANTGGGNYNFPASLAVGIATPTGKLTISQPQNATLINITQNIANNAIAIESTYAAATYAPGLMWYTTNNNPTRPRAGVWMQNSGTGSFLYFGTTNAYASGINNQAIVIGPSGNVGLSVGVPAYKLDVLGDINFTGALRVAGVTGTSGFVLRSNGAAAPSWVATSTLGLTGATTMAATNISAGAFGANTGGGNYTFPGTLGATGVITSSGGSANIGAHPSYGSTYSAFWRTGADFSLITDGTHTVVNAPVAGGSIYFRAANASPARMILTSTGLGIGTETPSYKLDIVSGGANTARIGTATGDTLTVGGGTGKINVGTVDPIYEINGKKFATYMAGMIGVKEEVAGNLILGCERGTCARTIDFASEPEGSDLWLFGKTTDIKKHLPQASIILTPAFDGRVSYRKEDGMLKILAQPFGSVESVEVSYRFTAPRFDSDSWGNTTDDDARGFIIND